MDTSERIESVILSNLQAPEARKIGVECECFFYDKDFKRLPVNPTTHFSATDFLNEMLDLQTDDEIKSGYSLEPGGQLEWASPPLISLHEIQDQFNIHRKRISKIAKRENLQPVNFSLEPIFQPSDIDLIKHKKYQLMDRMFQKTGELGPWMMRNTASIQINIDFSSKKEAGRMAYIADCLTPLASLLFANSPFWKRQPAGKRNLRYKIWNDTDPSRCGDLFEHGITSSADLVKKYARYIQTVPAIFIADNNKISGFEGTLGEWLSSLDKANKLTDKNIQTALHQIFTHVRFKNVLEIRGADRPPHGYDFTPAAFWIGLLLDNETQLEVFEIVNEWTMDERQELIASANNLDLDQIGPQNVLIRKWLERLCESAVNGLKKRSANFNIADESIFLIDYLDYFYKYGIPAQHIQKKQIKSGKSTEEFIKHMIK